MTEMTWEERLGRPRCCDQDWGGSHYHCARCNGVSSMYGHYSTGFSRHDKKVASHFCCPGDCELESTE